MPSKTFTFKGTEYSIDADEELLKFIDTVLVDYNQLASKPKLSDALKLWEKAKPIYEQKQLKIDYDANSTEVMRECLKDKYPDVDTLDDKTISYLFNNVLTVDSNTTATPTPTPATTVTKPSVVPITSAGGKGMSQQEMTTTLQQRRMSGQLQQQQKQA